MELAADDLSTWRQWQEFNQTRQHYPDEGGLLAWLARAANAHPDRPAVEVAGTTVSYRDLDWRSDRVADHLAAVGVQAGAIVAVTSSRTLTSYVGILGALKAGCGYLPVNAGDPEERLRFILRDGAAAALLLRDDELTRLSWASDLLPAGLIPLDAVPLARPAVRPARDRNRICYVIYTSGTTGKPKGVRITERNLLNFAHWFVTAHEMTAHDRLAQTAPLTFDPSVQQIFPAWATGACLLPVPEHELYDPFRLMRWLAAERVTVVDVVAGQWQHWRHAAEQDPALRDLPELRWVLLGAETIYHHDTAHWYRTVRSPALLRNLYGPTEATINATGVVVDPAVDTGQVSIGVPLPNYRLYAVGPDAKLCPPGVAGELYIAGDGVAAGYQSQQATREAFGDLSLPGGATERIYRTGDLARLVRDHTDRLVLEFAGRLDAQLKIRGFRIEPQEIEAAVKQVPGVLDAAVQVRAGSSEQLVCYFVAPEAVEVDLVRRHLAGVLAAYELPNLYLRMDRFPLTSNGKLDRPALSQALEATLHNRPGTGPRPATRPEEVIAEVWGEALGIAEVTRDEDFFALGGTSVLALSVVRSLRARGLQLPISDLFTYPTVGELAARIRNRSHDDSPSGSGRSQPTDGPTTVR